MCCEGLCLIVYIFLNPHPNPHRVVIYFCMYIRRQYHLVLTKVQSGVLSVRLRSILSIVMKDRHVFRGGTSADDEGDKLRREYYTDLIEQRKIRRATAASTSVRRTRSSVGSKKIELVGRHVIMSADVFGGREDQCYYGRVLCKTKYKEAGQTKHGFKVKWHDGDVDCW